MVYVFWIIFLVLLTFICLKHSSVIDKQENNL
jgi:hypothetical protein